jgi:hypothetical protein
MQTKSVVRMALPILVVGIAGCSPRSDHQRIFWVGDLTALDGRAVSSGIRLEIESAPSSTEPRRMVYRISTGCSLEGFVDTEGVISATESLRPCDAGDLSRIARLGAISGAALGAAQPPKATLLRTENTATLASPIGEAQFTTVP